VLPLLQRLILTGAVLLVPVELDRWRIFLGLIVVVGYLTLLQYVQPYNRSDMNKLATAAQFSVYATPRSQTDPWPMPVTCACGSRQLVCVFMGGAFVKLFSSNVSNDGSVSSCGGQGGDANRSGDALVAVLIMVGFNFGVLTLYVILAAYRMPRCYLVPDPQVSD